MASALETYQVQLYYHLASLRQLYGAEIRDALAALHSEELNLTNWVRIIPWQYAQEPLSSKGSLKAGGRFNIGGDLDPKNFPPFPVLYIAQNYQTAYAEKFGVIPKSSGDQLSGIELALQDPDSFCSVNINGHLSGLFNLEKPGSLNAFVEIIRNFKLPEDLRILANHLGISEPRTVTTVKQLKISLLARNWRFLPAQFGIPANPQVFGRLLLDAGFNGIIYRSTRHGGRCIAVFPQNLVDSDCYLEVADPPPPGIRLSRLDATSGWT